MKNPTALRIITHKSDLYAAGNVPDIAVEVPQLWDPFGKAEPMVEPVDEPSLSDAQLDALAGMLYGQNDSLEGERARNFAAGR